MSLVVMMIFVCILVYKRNLDDYLHQIGELNQNCRCKLSPIQRINNGKLEDNVFIPWSVSIARSGQHICMGVIVNQYFILTAQHCINHTSFDSRRSIEVRVGLYELFDEKLKEKTYHVSEIYKFPSFDYSNSLKEGDITFLKVSKPIKFQHNLVEPACLDLEPSYLDNNDTKNSDEKIFLSAGFGADPPVMYKSQTLMDKIAPSLILKVSTSTEVIEPFKSDPKLTYLLEMFICTNPIKKSNTNECYGFSGGSLNLRNENGLTVVKGIASSSIPIKYNETISLFCKSYSLYARLSYRNYRNFIDSVVGDLRCRADIIEKNTINSNTNVT